MPSRYLTRNLKQTAVYWGSPQAGAHGGNTFAEPIEISCRWEDKQELIIDYHGDEIKSMATVYTDRVVVNGGFLMLGSFDDLDSSAGTPEDNDNAHEIKMFESLPNVKATAFFRTAWL